MAAITACLCAPPASPFCLLLLLLLGSITSKIWLSPYSTRDQREGETKSKPAGVVLLEQRHFLLDSPLDGTQKLVIDACTSLLMV